MATQVVERPQVGIFGSRTVEPKIEFQLDSSLGSLEDVIGHSSVLGMVMVNPDTEEIESWKVFKAKLPVYKGKQDFVEGVGFGFKIDKKIIELVPAIKELNKIVGCSVWRSYLVESGEPFEEGNTIDVGSFATINDILASGYVWKLILCSNKDSVMCSLKYELRDEGDGVHYLLEDFWTKVRKELEYLHTYFKKSFAYFDGEYKYRFKLDLTAAVVAVDNGFEFQALEELRSLVNFNDCTSVQEILFYTRSTMPEEIVILDSNMEVIGKTNDPKRLVVGSYKAYMKNFIVEDTNGRDVCLLIPMQVSIEKR